MALKIAIASGKGGTGKTTTAVNLYHHLNRMHGGNVLLVDCDVEEPNGVLFFPDAMEETSSLVTMEIPVIDTSKCTFCRRCVEFCEFNAILVIPPVKFAEVNQSQCHSCGACQVACDHEAIWVKDQTIGNITRYSGITGAGIVEGNLKIGSAMQTMVIRSLKKSLHSNNNDILLFDAPPGTSCPVVETVSDTDFGVLVAEPTPFGLHDLKLMVALLRKLCIPFGVVINKADLGSPEIYEYLGTEGIEILAEIPFSRSFAAIYASGELQSGIPEEIDNGYFLLARKLSELRVTV